MTLPIYKAARNAAQIPKLPYLANYINCVIDNKLVLPLSSTRNLTVTILYIYNHCSYYKLGRRVGFRQNNYYSFT